jgi:hypothetical protein
VAAAEHMRAGHAGQGPPQPQGVAEPMHAAPSGSHAAPSGPSGPSGGE